MPNVLTRRSFTCLLLAFTAFVVPSTPCAAAERTDLSQLLAEIRGKAKLLESSAGMKQAYRNFTAAYGLTSESVSYSDFVVARLLFEATRDAGFWNLHWAITNLDPVSDNIWKQWKTINAPSPLNFTASAECDELSALFAFLAGRMGIKGVGLFWPYPNHTVAVWEIHQPRRNAVRVVIPTTQIFLTEADFFGTKAFNAWKQKSIFEYRRHDVPDNFALSRRLYDFFLSQIDRYAGASNTALQRLRYLREGIFLCNWTPESAAQTALKMREERGVTAEDSAAYWNFAEDMRTKSF